MKDDSRDDLPPIVSLHSDSPRTSYDDCIPGSIEWRFERFASEMREAVKDMMTVNRLTRADLDTERDRVDQLERDHVELRKKFAQLDQSAVRRLRGAGKK